MDEHSDAGRSDPTQGQNETDAVDESARPGSDDGSLRDDELEDVIGGVSINWELDW